MKTFAITAALAIVMAIAGSANAADITVSEDISVSTTWTSDNTYTLSGQIYVLPGAALTIEAGTNIVSDAEASTDDPISNGALAVTRGAQIFINGTATEPVTFTSSADDRTNWRIGANEWGNLTIMGDAYICQYSYGGQQVRYNGRDNSKTPNALNQAQMEGLVAAGDPDPNDPVDPNVMYGGGNDDDDSGTINYASFRYGGRVVGLTNELNGLSLGGIGRGTDIDYVEIMNNVDDGIEIWGGTVNLKHVVISNIGDDSLDIDQGWRGKVQFGLIIQGYSLANGNQGGGIGDNCMEMDGPEDSDGQPGTYGAMYNMTVIGEPYSGDYGACFRDNCKMQIRNSIFMDQGDRILCNEGTADGQSGYGFNGTKTFVEHWNSAYDQYPTVNYGGDWAGDPASDHYDTMVDGNLLEIRDSVFYNVVNPGNIGDETKSDGLDIPGVDILDPALGNDTTNILPIQALTRAAASTESGKLQARVTFINPCAASIPEISANAMAPDDGFFDQVPYRGAFSSRFNWLAGWTALDEYGMTDTSMNGTPGASDPVVTVQLTASLAFQTVDGVSYIIDENDGSGWTAIAGVVGNGEIMTVNDLVEYDASKTYRVRAID